MARPRSSRVASAGRELGANLATARKLQGLTAQQVAERAGISRNLVGRIEQGHTTATLGAFLEVVRALGLLDDLVRSSDPYETDVGRLRADEVLPKRVRR